MPSAMSESAAEQRDSSEVEISRLFPKCRPRSTPTSPSNPPSIPNSFSTSLAPSDFSSYPVHSNSTEEFSASHSTSAIIHAALNRSPHINPNTITYSANSLPVHSLSNTSGIISSLTYDPTVYTSNTHVLPFNGKPSSVSAHSKPHNFNFIAESDANDNYERSNTDEVPRMQESSTGSSSSNTSIGSNSSSRMSVDTASSNCSPSGGVVQTSMNNSADASVISGYHEVDHSRSTGLDSSYEDVSVQQSRREHFRLRDSRIEAAGGRELYSHSRSRMHRHRGGSASLVTPHSNSMIISQQHSKQQQQQQLVQLQQQNQQLGPQSLNAVNQVEQQMHKQNPLDHSSASSSCSRTSRESGLPPDSPLVYEARLAGSSEVVFDDIGEWSGGLTVRGVDGQTHASSTPTSGPDSESPEVSPSRVTKIGNVPIADYEGSPRRYGPRSGNLRISPRQNHSMRPRPGFPRRVSTFPEDKKITIEKPGMGLPHSENHPKKDKWVGDNGVPSSVSHVDKIESPVPHMISTLTSVYASTLNDTMNTNSTTSTTASEKASAPVDQEPIYDYEVSETQKVLQDFFKDSRVTRTPTQAFYDLEYHLKRHHGNSYVGQRLAEEYEADFSVRLKDVAHESAESASLPDNVRRKSDCASDDQGLAVGGGCEGQGGQVVKIDNLESSRNFTLSPDSTSCDSGEVESSEFSGGEGEESARSSSRGGHGSAMPVLEDGLSSGDESEMGEHLATIAPPSMPAHVHPHYHYAMHPQLYQQPPTQLMEEPVGVPPTPQAEESLTFEQQQMNEKLREQKQIMQQVEAEGKLHYKQMRLIEKQAQLELHNKHIKQKELEKKQQQQQLKLQQQQLKLHQHQQQQQKLLQQQQLRTHQQLQQEEQPQHKQQNSILSSETCDVNESVAPKSKLPAPGDEFTTNDKQIDEAAYSGLSVQTIGDSEQKTNR
ncbi:uncharacterized protein LOC108674532 [Hyalella azteca]|uniref:Uncharacterized protein LOC108674532 n=1 Tax=Hyalella azteca TaxID=294128 RepID=A0A979FNL3_HYAAZ|nr:uncharacterized protein LOC108674532 [Hyalella azteca]